MREVGREGQVIVRTVVTDDKIPTVHGQEHGRIPFSDNRGNGATSVTPSTLRLDPKDRSAPTETLDPRVSTRGTGKTPEGLTVPRTDGVVHGPGHP